MQAQKSIGRVLLGAGIILFLVSLLADVIGVGWYGMVDAKAALKAGGAQVAAIAIHKHVAEEALQRSEARFRDFADIAADPD